MLFCNIFPVSIKLCNVMDSLQSHHVKPMWPHILSMILICYEIFVFKGIRQINELITCKNPVSHPLQRQSNFLEFTVIIYVLVIGLSGVCNHTSDEKVGRPRSGSPICLSRVRLQTE